MMKFTRLVIVFLMLAGVTWSQEVMISGFPTGVAGSVSEDFFEPYSSELRALADSLTLYPRAYLVVTGGADGQPYRQEHDARNPSLALGRAHVVRNLLVSRYNVDSTRLIVQSVDFPMKGPEYRFARVRLVLEGPESPVDLSNLERRIAELEARPPVEKHFTEIKEVPQVTTNWSDYLGLQFSAGASTSPFGGLPMIAGAVSWKRMIYLEGLFGYSLWNSEYTFENEALDTKRRMAGGQLIVFPLENIPVGVVGGWVRIEEISESYYKYVQLSEGPMLGLRANPLKFISVTGTYNPSRHRITEDVKSMAKNGQFMLTLAAFYEIGGLR